MPDYQRPRRAAPSDLVYIPRIRDLIRRAAAEEQWAMLAERSESYLTDKIEHGLAAIALSTTGDDVIGFGALAPYPLRQPAPYRGIVSFSAFVVAPAYRGSGVYRDLKDVIWQIREERYAATHLAISLTDKPWIMRDNQRRGLVAVPYEQLTTADDLRQFVESGTSQLGFWDGCLGCPFYSAEYFLKVFEARLGSRAEAEQRLSQARAEGKVLFTEQASVLLAGEQPKLVIKPGEDTDDDYQALCNCWALRTDAPEPDER